MVVGTVDETADAMVEGMDEMTDEIWESPTVVMWVSRKVDQRVEY
jgi:hypothetical protein